MAPDDANGRVLAVLQAELEHVKEQLSLMNDLLAEERKDNRASQNQFLLELKNMSTQIVSATNLQIGRIAEIEKNVAVQEQKWKGHRQEHAKENRVVIAINATVTAIFTTFGIFIKP